jgi:hypothetical protein
MKISHEALSNIPDLTNLSQANAPTAPKLQAQSEPLTIPNPATTQDPAILDHVLGSAPGLSTASDSAKNATDSLQDMSDVESLRLQQLMDNRSQLEQTLSNILKKQDDTASQLLKNLKG